MPACIKEAQQFVAEFRKHKRLEVICNLECNERNILARFLELVLNIHVRSRSFESLGIIWILFGWPVKAHSFMANIGQIGFDKLLDRESFRANTLGGKHYLVPLFILSLLG